MKHVSERELWEAAEYYTENSFGYDGIEDYVRMDFYFVKDEAEIQRIIDFISKNIDTDESMAEDMDRYAL